MGRRRALVVSQMNGRIDILKEHNISSNSLSRSCGSLRTWASLWLKRTEFLGLNFSINHRKLLIFHWSFSNQSKARLRTITHMKNTPSKVSYTPVPPLLHQNFICMLEWWDAEATGLSFVCFVTINPHLLSANRVDYGLYLFHTLSNFTPPLPVRFQHQHHPNWQQRINWNNPWPGPAQRPPPAGFRSPWWGGDIGLAYRVSLCFGSVRSNQYLVKIGFKVDSVLFSVCFNLNPCVVPKDWFWGFIDLCEGV